MQPASTVLGQYVFVQLDAQQFALPVTAVREVLFMPPLATIPLAPPTIRGAFTWRGQPVTVINLRRRLGLPEVTVANPMLVVVMHGDEPIALMVDRVGTVERIDTPREVPPHLDAAWQSAASAVSERGGELAVVLDVDGVVQGI